MMQRGRASGLRWLLAAAFVFCIPAAAEAHTVIKGMNEFVSGAAHPLLTPAHIMILIGLGLLGGQHSFPVLKVSMIGFTIAAAAALAFTATNILAAVYPPILIALLFVVGALVAWARPLPWWAVAGLFTGGALAMGLDSGVGRASPSVVIKTLIGTWFSLSLLVFDIAYYVSMAIQKKWLNVGARVLGSWLLAIAFLMLAFFLKKHS